jgi:hypothetical protein
MFCCARGRLRQEKERSQSSKTFFIENKTVTAEAALLGSRIPMFAFLLGS